MPEGSPFADDSVLNVLLISTDERTEAVNDADAFTNLGQLDGSRSSTEFSSDARADSLILASLNIDEDTIKLVSIERATGVPILLDELVSDGSLRSGQRALCVGFGGGLTWAGALLEIGELR